MNKQEFVAALAAKAEITKKEANEVTNAFLEVVTEELAAGNSVRFTGFGVFEVRDRKAREGRNPRNPEEVIQIPARTVPAFKAGKTLKEAVDNK